MATRFTVLAILLLAIPIGIFFFPIYWSGDSFSYRDSGRFYYRQFQWNAEHWRSGRVPLWNDQGNLGAPVVAEASSSVFYPLQAIFLIPGVRFGSLMVAYAAIHVFLAGLGCFWLARNLRCSPMVSCWVATSYALSGSVVFQTCNIVFLVGASWLPWGIYLARRVTQQPGLIHGCGLAMSLALPVLGGDPQTSYHIGLVVLVWLLVRRFSDRRFSGRWFSGRWFSGRRRSSSENEPGKPMVLAGPVFRLGLCAILAIGLSAVQVLPSWQAARHSTRQHFLYPRTIVETIQGQPSPAVPWWDFHPMAGLFGHPVSGTHHDHLYQFSQPPWSMIELAWPNISGDIQPTHQRWSDYIPAAGRVWTPSLYCGLLTFVLFLAAMIRRDRQTESRSPPDEASTAALANVRWLKFTALIFGLGSLGWFGLGWVIHEIANASGFDDPASIPVGAPVGGVYWLFVVFLPGYVSFRYPAKLFVVATLMICLLAGREFQRRAERDSLGEIRRYLKGFVLLSGLILVGLWLGSAHLNQVFRSFPTMSEFGPFDSQRCWSGIITALIHSSLVATCGLLVLNQGWTKSRTAALILLLSMVELAFANHRLLLTAHGSEWNRQNQIAAELSERHRGESTRIYRTDPMTWSSKQQWMRQRSGSRLSQIVIWENQTLMPRHHLKTKLGVLESFRSLEPLDQAMFMAFGKSLKGISTNDSADAQLVPNPIFLGMLGVRYWLMPNWGKPKIPAEMVEAGLSTNEQLLVRNPYAQPRLRIAHTVYSTRAEDRESGRFSAVIEEATGEDVETFFADPNQILLEDADSTGSRILGTKSSDRNRIQVLRDDETSVELEVETDGGVLVIADAYDPDWIAEKIALDGTAMPLEMKRANFVLRGIELGPGLHRIRMTYRPALLWIGGWISLFSLIVWLGMCSWLAWNRGRTRPQRL